jgi:hypothetical protein
MSGNEEKTSVSKSVQLSGPPAYWFFILGVVFWGVYIRWALERTTVRGYWLTVGLPGLALVAGIVGAIGRAFGKSIAVWICGMTVLAGYWTLTFIALIAFAIQPGYLLYFGIFAIPMVLITVISTLPFAKREGKHWALLGMGVGLVCAILVVRMWLAERSPRAEIGDIPASAFFES